MNAEYILYDFHCIFGNICDPMTAKDSYINNISRAVLDATVHTKTWRNCFLKNNINAEN